MTTQDQQIAIDYAMTLEAPAEKEFFTPVQIEDLKNERQKFQESQNFVSAIKGKQDFEDRLEKAIIDGKVYSGSQMEVVTLRNDALDGYGDRIDIPESLVSKSGNWVIMSERLQKLLGFVTDGYMLKKEIDQLMSAMQADGVPGPEVDRAVAALNKNGAIGLQRGVFLPLKSMLEEAIGRSFSLRSKPQVEVSVQAPSKQVTAPGAELHISFIEYLKNTDKDYDRVEYEVSHDPKFLEFFNNLKSHYAYYKSLSDEKMVAEIVVRPQLWIKLSPNIKESVLNIVERNRGPFMAKIDQVASLAHVNDLVTLKQNLSK
ncbi:MAG: hypothetical protein KW793_01400 [Candidatus Doudnabacteria bacterium]|nr:hypothetical protein [Candidatus Doudnabacteria bacterium]